MNPLYIAIISAVGAILAAGIIFLIVRKFRKKITVIDESADYWTVQHRQLVELFENYNVMTYGAKGSGKDLITALVIFLRGEKHYSNIYYDDNTEIRELSDLHCGGNTYDDFVNGTVKKFDANFEDGCDFYISDGGIYLGCQYNKELNSKYPEMPIHFALRRHLYDSRIHINSQALGRPWDKLREQQNAFIHTLKMTDCGDCLVVSAISYTRYESALECLPPPVKEDKYEIMKFGQIREHKFLVRKEWIKYDTRHFRGLLIKEIKQEVKNNERANICIR